MRCITVDSESGLYLAGRSMIPTHNTITGLAAVLQYVMVPGYRACVIRRTNPELEASKGFIQVAKEWLMSTDADWSATRKRWTFPSGATLDLRSMEHEDDKFGFDGSAYHCIMIDEIRQLSESQYSYLFRSLRKEAGDPIPLRMRAATNPGPDWIVKRWGIQQPSAINGNGRSMQIGPKGRRFIPAYLDENPHLDQEYFKTLDELDPVERSRQRDGNWWAVPEGNMFKRLWFRIIKEHEVPAGIQWARYWDLAATEAERGKDPANTAGVKMGLSEGKIYIPDVQIMQGDPGDVQNLVLQTTQLDTVQCMVWMEQEGGSGGKNTIASYRNLLIGYPFRGDRVSGKGSKIERASPWSAWCSGGNRVYLVDGPWNQAYIDEHCIFPQKGFKKDQVDASSGAYSKVAIQGARAPRQVTHNIFAR